MDRLKVAPERVRSTAEQFNEQANQVKNLANTISQIISAMSSIWQGEAASAYTNKIKSMNENLTVICTKITKHGTHLQEIAAEYQSAERANTEASSALSSSLIS
ncbi:WXG100 family type VII secretion target [Lachnospiraceae bacterium KH1T2]|nr:WXG100 family type VII secretion target [Lachnospiraceae bacterium KH1T2]